MSKQQLRFTWSNTRICNYLKKRNLDWMKEYDSMGLMPIHAMCREGDLDTVTKLIENQCDVNALDHHGWNAIFRTSFHVNSNQLKIAKLLLMNGADLHIRDNKGWCPMVYVHQNTALLKLFIEYKVDVNMLLWDDFMKEDTALKHCLSDNEPERVQLLLDAGARYPIRLLQRPDMYSWRGTECHSILKRHHYTNLLSILRSCSILKKVPVELIRELYTFIIF